MWTRPSSGRRASPPPQTARSRCGRWSSVDDARAVVGRVFREEANAAVATVARAVRDLDIAEEAVQDAFTRALGAWPARGVPDNPAAWIIAAAKNAAIDRLRGTRRSDQRQAQLEALARIQGEGEDDETE